MKKTLSATLLILTLSTICLAGDIPGNVVPPPPPPVSTITAASGSGLTVLTDLLLSLIVKR